jgi:predicted membrane-bound spermidine synthase
VFWLVTALVAGAVVMALEMLAFRLYAPYFGYSIYVWGNLIWVVLAALAVGYAAGGWLADRSRSDFRLYLAITGSGLYHFGLVFSAHSILGRLASMGEIGGAIVATLVIFLPPMLTLAAVGPFLVRLLARAGRVGLTSGAVYAVSTLGSILGVLVTTFVLIPSVGTHDTLVFACVTTLALGVAGLLRRSRWAAAALLPLLVLPARPSESWSEDTIWAADSPYHLVRVRRRGDLTGLFLDREDWIQSVRSDSEVWTHQVFDDYALGPLLVDARRILVLGMGAGGSIRAARITAPGAEFDAVEIDPRVVEAAGRFFGLRPGPGLRIHLADARAWTRSAAGGYDIVQLDVYRGGPPVPFYLTTLEFFHAVRAAMTKDALLMMNVIDVGPDLELLRSTAATLGRVFDSLCVLSKSGGNHMIFAFTRATNAAELRERLRRIESAPAVARLVDTALPALVDLSPETTTRPFTDDLAPVEQLSRRMLSRREAKP